jgi:AraC-like DNA-binding protein
VAELEVGALYIWFGVWSTWLGVEGWRYSERRFPMMAPPSPVSAPSVESAEAAPGPGPDWADLGSAWQSRTQQEGWWREPDLTLADLARRLGTNTTYLSRAINEGLGLNFNELVNRMRAAETARLIEADAQANLVQIALEAGFSSKATFNRVFRAVYGHSPSEHRRLKSHISQGAQESEASNSSEIGKPAG